MKKIIFMFVFVLFITGTYANNKKSAGNANAANANSVMNIKGKVIDQVTGEALAGVALKVEGNDKNFYTDFNGDFSIEGISPGVYDINISYVSYKEVALRGINTGNNDVKLKVELNSVSPE